MSYKTLQTFVFTFITLVGLWISCVSSHDYVYNPVFRAMISPSCSQSPSRYDNHPNSQGPSKEYHHRIYPSETITPTPFLKTPEPRQTPPPLKPNISFGPKVPGNLITSPSWSVQNLGPSNQEKPVESATNNVTPMSIDVGLGPQEVLCQFGFDGVCSSPSSSITPTPSTTPSSSITPSPSQSLAASPSQSLAASPTPSPTPVGKNSKDKEEKIDSEKPNDTSEDSKNSDKDGDNSQKGNNDANGALSAVCQTDPNEQLTCNLPSPFFVEFPTAVDCCTDEIVVRDKCIESCTSSLTGIDCGGLTTNNCPSTGTETIDSLCNDVCDGMSEDTLFSLCTSGVEAPVTWVSLSVTRPTGDGCDLSSCIKIDGDMSVSNNLPLADNVEELSFEFPTTPNLEPADENDVTKCVDYNACLADCVALLPTEDDTVVSNTGTHLSVGNCIRTSCSTNGKEACEKACDAVSITMQGYRRDPDVCAQCLSDPVGQKCKVRVSVTKSTDFGTKTVKCGVSVLSLAPPGTQAILDFTLQQTVKSL